MKPYTQFWIEQDMLYVRCEQAEKPIFHAWLFEFRKQFPYSQWKPELGAWKLPLRQVENVAMLSRQVFGSDTFIPRQSNTGYNQLELPFS